MLSKARKLYQQLMSVLAPPSGVKSYANLLLLYFDDFVDSWYSLALVWRAQTFVLITLQTLS
jgi:hypothetical protein